MLCFRKKSRGTSTPASIKAGLWGSYAEGEGTDRPAVVIANGSGSIRAGFSGKKEPQAVFPNIVGRSKASGVTFEQKDYSVGQAAEEKRGVLNLRYPIEHGIVTNWDDMEKIWKYTFTDVLKVQPDKQPVLLTEVPLNPKGNREKMTQIMFDTFNVPKLRIVVDAELALLATGQPTGVVLESGDDVTHAVPIIEGRHLPFATCRMNLAGRDLTDYLVKILSDSGLQLTSYEKRAIVKDIKEKLCYVAADFESELAAAKAGTFKDVTYEMPDGQVITIGSQRFRCPELLFQPSLTGKEFGGIHQQTFDAIMKCDQKPVRNRGMEQEVYDAIPVCGVTPNTKKDLFANVVLSGGSTMFSGLADRLLAELQKVAPKDMKPHVLAPPEKERKHLKWIGGSMWASAAQSIWITKEEYDEWGPGVVNKYSMLTYPSGL